MKFSYKHIIEYIPSKPSVDEISQHLFQLGHEHEVHNNIFDLELTPNRGDCLSLIGVLRDLRVFYDINLDQEIYEKQLDSYDIDFQNHAPDECPHISFLKIEIDGHIKPYKSYLENYFKDMDIKKNNFFTDISNYIAYEMGQPTHCYDAEKINGPISLNFLECNKEFLTLQDEKIQLSEKNLVFKQNNEIINLAGIMGGMSSACSDNTKTVIIECAYFNPKNIIGKSTKYNIKSDAAYKFERGTDPKCHEHVLRRFLKIVEQHTNIIDVRYAKKDFKEFQEISIKKDSYLINKILGTTITDHDYHKYLCKLGFKSLDNKIIVPSYRGDIENQNDIAEEIARVIGYDNIENISFDIPPTRKSISYDSNIENCIRNSLLDFGFFEVINNPFIDKETMNSIEIDNPLDSNRKFLRTTTKESLIKNLIYNERRQKDSVKLFEISDVYSFDSKLNSKRVIGIICSGRVSKNYIDFSKRIDSNYLLKVLKNFSNSLNYNILKISRDNIDSKSDNPIYFIEIELKQFDSLEFKSKIESDNPFQGFIKYKPISEYPSSYRDLSFSITKHEEYYELQDMLLSYKHELLKEVFVFDFYLNEKLNVIKIGFRFIFQSNTTTITDIDVNNIMHDIIDKTTSMDGVQIPGIYSS